MGKKKGFTLIELLVVIAIIALLMSILMPALARVRNQAKMVVCRSNLKQLALSAAMYVDSHGGTFNDGWISASKGGKDSPWHYDFLPYYNDVKLLLCPMANKTTGQPGYYGSTFKAYDYTFVTAITGDPPAGHGLGPEDSYGSGSFGINEWVSNAPKETTDWLASFGPPSQWWRSPNVRGANKIPLLLDCVASGPYPEAGEQGPPEYGSQDAATLSFISNYCLDRHSGYVDAVFMDFSSRKVGLKELWTFEWCRGDNTANAYTIIGQGGDKTACAIYWDGKAPWMKNMKEY